MMSPARSMSGWSFKIWLKRNKSSLKTLIAGLFSVLGAWASTLVLPPWAVPVPALLIGFASRLALDMLDFWLGDVEVQQ